MRQEKKGEAGGFAAVLLKPTILFVVLLLLVSVLGIRLDNRIVEEVLLAAVLVTVSFYLARLCIARYDGAPLIVGLSSGLGLVVLLCILAALGPGKAPDILSLGYTCLKVFPASAVAGMTVRKKIVRKRK